MTIHQIQVRYDPTADRLLLSVRTTAAEVYTVWLTRRLVMRMHPPLRQTVARLGVAQALPQSLPVPEARQMLEQQALQRPLPGADFAQPFAAGGTQQPLGAEPLLPSQGNLSQRPDGTLVLALGEERGRRLELTMSADIATALLRLVESALATSEWQQPGAPVQAADDGPGAPGAPPTPPPGRLLN